MTTKQKAARAGLWFVGLLFINVIYWLGFFVNGSASHLKTLLMFGLTFVIIAIIVGLYLFVEWCIDNL
jgi:apolipoprotein N-acyltransferase